MTALHFILARHGRDTYWVERDANEMDRATTLRDLVAMQVDKPLQVWAAEDGRWTNISEDIALELIDLHHKADEVIPDALADFISLHVSDHIALSLRRAA